MNKNIILAGGLAVFLIVGAFVFSYFRNTDADGGYYAGKSPTPIRTQETEPGLIPGSGPILGAIPGNEVFSREFGLNGLWTYSAGTRMTNATNTPCIFPLPAATSTLVNAFAIYEKSQSVTLNGTVHMIVRDSTYATTSIIGSTSALLGAKITATSTPSGTNRELPQNGWLEVRHTASSSYTGTGYCGYHSQGAPS